MAASTNFGKGRLPKSWKERPPQLLGRTASPNFGNGSLPKFWKGRPAQILEMNASPNFGSARLPKFWNSDLRRSAQMLGDAAPNSGNHVSRIWAELEIIENANPITKKLIAPKVEHAPPKCWGGPSGWSPQILETHASPNFGEGDFPKFGKGACSDFG